jgi:beta-mannosidase
LLSKTSAEALKVKRNHVSLTFWSGGNELTDVHHKPVTYEDENINMLKRLCDELNPRVLMLPSSASGPAEYISFDNPENNHDVHGYWIYHGVTEHYKLYNKVQSMLHSEFGCGSMTNYDKFERFLSEKHRKVFAVSDNPVWKHHAEWWDMLKVNAPIFGIFEENELETLVKISQVIQGDGIRYILDTNRRNQFKNTGSIIWQFNEPWTNIAGSSLVDYWGDAKYALKVTGEAFRPRNASLRHNGIVYEENDIFTGEVFAVNNLLGGLRGNLKIYVLDDEGDILYDDCADVICDEGTAAAVRQIEFKIGPSPCYHVNLVLNDGEEDIKSQYFFLVKRKNGFCDKKPVLKIYDKMMK